MKNDHLTEPNKLLTSSASSEPLTGCTEGDTPLRTGRKNKERGTRGTRSRLKRAAGRDFYLIFDKVVNNKNKVQIWYFWKSLHPFSVCLFTHHVFDGQLAAVTQQAPHISCLCDSVI